MKRCVLSLVLAFGSLLGAGSSAHAASSVGLETLVLRSTATQRALPEVAVFYPTSETRPLTPFAETRAYVNQNFQRGAAPEAGRHPLIILSHGNGGTWGDLSWLAENLVWRGYVVVALNHPGTTYLDHKPSTPLTLAERPRDISHVIDALTSQAPWAGLIDPSKIAVIGHALGGWTALEIAGGRFDTAKFLDDCVSHPQIVSCGVVPPRLSPADRAEAIKTSPLAQSFKDSRVTAVVTLEGGLSQGFTPDSLMAITIPVLLITGGPNNPLMPLEREGQYIAQNLPPDVLTAKRHVVQINDAGPHSFLQVCKPLQATIFRSVDRQQATLCQDIGPRDRATIHAKTTEAVAAFLAEVWKR